MFEFIFLNPYIIFIAGGLLLYFGSDYLIDNAIVIATKFNLSKIFIGSTIVALGTSLPEIVVSIISNINGNSNIAIGNIVGSNITNLTLVIGVLLLFKVIRINNDSKIKFHLSFLMFITVLFYFLLRTGSISIYFGLILIFSYLVYIIVSFLYFDDSDIENIGELNSQYPLLKVILSSAVIYFGSNLFIDGAIGISLKLGVSDLIVGMTVVALGTSAPEIIVSVNSILKKQIDISIGNIIGSNIANIVFAIGLSSIIKKIYFSSSFLSIYNNYMFFVTFFVIISLLVFRKINKKFSLLFISIYFVFIYLNFYISN